jgi:hypothetical protein
VFRRLVSLDEVRGIRLARVSSSESEVVTNVISGGEQVELLIVISIRVGEGGGIMILALRRG